MVDPETRKANLPPNLLAGPGYDGQQSIYKLKVRGSVQLRPMVCIGPFGLDEWTVLYPATEVGNVLCPADAARLAEERRKEILADPNRRQLLIDDGDDDDDEKH